MADMLEIANEVQDTLGRSYGMPDDIDEADLDAGWLDKNITGLKSKIFAIFILLCFCDFQAVGSFTAQVNNLTINA